jgi:hypothetical protein
MHDFVAELGIGNTSATVRVVQMRAGQTFEDIFDRVREADLAEGRLALPLIIRLPIVEQIPKAELTKKARFSGLSRFFRAQLDQEAFRRVPDRPVHILTSEAGRAHVTVNINLRWDFASPGIIRRAAVLHDIRRAELSYILEQSRAILAELPGSYYKVPSGRFTRSFIRVGNIQYDRDAIDGLLFWLMPHLSDCAGILTDTWSISSLALAAGSFASSYYGGRSRPVEVLRSYADGSDFAERQMRDSISHLVAECSKPSVTQSKLLCLVSATHSGSLKNKLDEVLRDLHGEFAFDFLPIFSLSSDNTHPPMLDLSTDTRFAAITDIDIASRTVVEIDPQVYFPLSFTDAVHGINIKIAQESRSFLDGYRGRDVVRVHQTHFQNGSPDRHHAIYLDTLKLVKTKRFVGRLNKILASLNPAPSLIVYSEHVAGQELGRACERYYSRKGLAIATFIHATLGPPPKSHKISPLEKELFSAIKALGKADTILVIDDAFITGRRINQFNTNLRSYLKYAGKIQFLVGVARPSSDKDWTKCTRRLSHREDNLPPHDLKSVEKIILPNWNENRCPWCEEHRLYDRLAESAELPTALKSRQIKLEARDQGLTDDLFLNFHQYEKLSLGPKSLFVKNPATQAEVFAGVAASIQHLRDGITSNLPPLGKRRFPVSTILEHRDYLLETWTDSVLRASFLRACDREELCYADRDMEAARTEVMKELIVQEDINAHDVSMEFVLAALVGKSDLLTKTNIAETIRRRCKEGVADFLLASCGK